MLMLKKILIQRQLIPQTFVCHPPMVCFVPMELLVRQEQVRSFQFQEILMLMLAVVVFIQHMFVAERFAIRILFVISLKAKLILTVPVIVVNLIVRVVLELERQLAVPQIMPATLSVMATIVVEPLLRVAMGLRRIPMPAVIQMRAGHCAVQEPVPVAVLIFTNVVIVIAALN